MLMIPQISRQGCIGSLLQNALYFTASKRKIQVIFHELWHICNRRDVPLDRFGMNLGQRIVEGLSIAQGLVYWWIKSIHKTQFERIGAVKVVLEFTKSEFQRHDFFSRPGCDRSLQGHLRLPRQYSITVREF